MMHHDSAGVRRVCGRVGRVGRVRWEGQVPREEEEEEKGRLRSGESMAAQAGKV